MEKLTDDIIVRHKGREFVLSASSVVKKIGKYTYFLPEAGVAIANQIETKVKKVASIQNGSD